MIPKVIAFVPDTHCGSTTGLLRPGFVTVSEGRPLGTNAIQDWLWQRYSQALTFIDKVRGTNRFGVVFGGDHVEGRHHGTMQLIHQDIEVHAEVAEDVLRPVRERAYRAWMMRGTECHARTKETALGKALDCERDPTTGDWCWEQIQLDIEGVLTHFKHHTGAASRQWTQGGAAIRSLAQEQLTAIELRHPVPYVVMRAHAHNFNMYRGTRGLSVCAPPWQLQTRYGRRYTEGSFSVPGIVILDYREMQSDGLPEVHYELYRPDPDPVVGAAPLPVPLQEVIHD